MEAAAPVVDRKGSAEEIGLALWTAAQVDRTALSGAEFTITREIQGFECLKSMTPLEYEDRGDIFRIMSTDQKGFKVYRLREGETECNDDNFFQWINEDKFDFASLILFKLIKQHDSVRAQFAEYLVSPELRLRKALHEAFIGMQDSDWTALGHWIIYCFDLEEISS